MPRFGLDHSYARDLPGGFMPASPAPAPAPRLLYLNTALAAELGLPAEALQSPLADALFSGQQLPEDAQPIAQAYAGHQFGGFSPQLGDGRALLLGEVTDRAGQRRDIAFKGSGRTPFSRGGDGKAAVGPMLREVLIGEAMHALGVPTTRALAVAATGDLVQRDRALPGAVLTRVAASHLRVGSFQYFAARGDTDTLGRLLDHAVARHDPALAALPHRADRALGLLQAVARRQARLLAQWLNLGFIHGVMNTDNMTISGETIDYGPCAFMEAYNPATVFSSIDHGGRYAYANQPLIARWNLARLAEALLPLMAEADDQASVDRAVAQVTAVIDAFPAWHAQALLQGQRAKLGLLTATPAQDEDDQQLAADWLALLQAQDVDFTTAWRALADVVDPGQPATSARTLQALFSEPTSLNGWMTRWRARLSQETVPAPQRASAMRLSNPWIIPRNHRVEEALGAATAGDLAPFKLLLAAVCQPWQSNPAHAHLAEPAPAAVTACYQTFCGT